MTFRKITGLTAAASLVALAMAAPAMAQAKIYPQGTDCATLSEGDKAACMKQFGLQEDTGTQQPGEQTIAPQGPGTDSNGGAQPSPDQSGHTGGLNSGGNGTGSVGGATGGSSNSQDQNGTN